jgi:hypothetical protein
MTFTTPTSRPEPKRDRWGRYLLPDPVTGRERAWTRATTFAKTVSDMYGLGKWQERMVAFGVANRPDLYALAASTKIDDKGKFDRICEDAKEAAKASSGANLGTALHAFTEQIDAGQDVTVPQPWDTDVKAYTEALTHARITIHRGWIERIVVFPEYGIAGTLDRIVGHPGWPRFRIADVKTGKTLDYSWGEIAIQLAIYANSRWAWQPELDEYDHLPDVDQQSALVMHLPVGQGRCDLYDVDIAAGLEALQLCADVRLWRARKGIAVPHADTVSPPDKGEMFDLIVTATSREAVETLWRANPTTWTPAHTDLAKRRLAALEAPAGTTGGTSENEHEKEKETAA